MERVDFQVILECRVTLLVLVTQVYKVLAVIAEWKVHIHLLDTREWRV